MTNRMKLIDAIAETIWNAESMRVTGKKRQSLWSEESEATHESYRFVARQVLNCIRKHNDSTANIK